MCKVSVLIPIYNAGKYLSACLESAVHQLLDDIEIICINDGSTDESIGILQEYQKQFPQIRILNKKNTGYGHSMNVGIHEANGEYIGIIESDDFAEYDMFSVLYDAAIHFNADIVKSDYYSFKDGEDIYNAVDGINYGTVFSPRKNKTFVMNPPSAIWTSIYRRSFLYDNNIFFLETPGASYQDTSFWIKAILSTERMIAIPRAFIHYRMDNENSSINSMEKVFCICDEFAEIWQFLSERPDIKKEVQFYLPVKQYSLYRWSYNRIANRYRRQFIRRMSQEFSVLAEAGLLREECWPDKDAWRHVQDVIHRPEKVYYETYGKSQECRLYGAALEAELHRAGKLYIYGAGQVARKAIGYLKGKGIVPAGILVSSMAGNPESLLGVEVRAVDTVSPTSDSAVMIAIREQDQYEVLPRLEALGWKHIIALNRTAREALQI